MGGKSSKKKEPIYDSRKEISSNQIPNSISNFTREKKKQINLKEPTREYFDDESLPVTETETQGGDKNDFDLSQLVKVEMKLRNKLLNPTKSISTQMMLKIGIEEVKSDIKASIDLVCVIDKSGSMNGEKINLLKDSFKTIVEYLGPKDRMSLVCFSTTSERITPLMCMTEENKTKLLDALVDVKAGGGTDISAGVYDALQVLVQRRDINKVSSILVLSDGLDPGAADKINILITKYENQIKNAFTINTFGYGSDHDPELMNRIASFKDGGFNFIDKLDTMDECFLTCVGGLISLVAQKAEISVSPNPDSQLGIKISNAYGADNFWKLHQDGSYKATLLNLISGKTNHLIFDVEIPLGNSLSSDVKEMIVASGNIDIKPFGVDSKIINLTADCIVTLTDDKII
jgi:Mg-chelatase subunit ChlD